MLLIFENDFNIQRINKKSRRNQEVSSTISTFLLVNIMRKEREWYILPRSTHWVEVCLFSSEFFSDVQFKESFRMSRTSFYTLHELLRPFIEKKSTVFREPVPSDRRLAIFLYHVAHGATLLAISNQFACGKSTVCGIVTEITEAIIQHLTKKYISFSTTEQAMRSIEFWRAKSGIPGVVACLDGTHIQIIRPSKSGTAYFNRKGYYSINVQGMHLWKYFI
jgi:hypothetical protein